MINFSTYPELVPFIIPDLTISKPGDHLPDFREAFFNQKRARYVNYLEDIEDKIYNILSDTLNHHGSVKPLDPITSDIREMISFMENRTLSKKFRWTENIFSGIDYAYDFYRDLLGYSSRVSGLKTYDELYETMFDNVYTTTNQIFNKVGTRGQLLGYIELNIDNIKQYMDTLISDIESSLSWTDAWTVANSAYVSFISEMAQFETNVNTALSDIQLLVQPVVKYLNLLELGSDIITDNWGTFGVSPIIRPTIDKYNKEVINFTADYHLETSGISSQILEHLRPSIKPDSSNFELIITKSIKLGFVQNNIHDRLTVTNSELINPGY